MQVCPMRYVVMEELESRTLLASTPFAWGVSGHPLTFWAYTTTPVNEQLDTLKRAGASWYRFDVDAASAAGGGYMDALQSAAATKGVKLLPVLNFGPDLSKSPTENYNTGKALAQQFAQRYGASIDTYEIGNEMDGLCIISSGVTGQYTTEYDQTKYEICREWIKGAIAGVKAADPTAKFQIDGVWEHWGFIQKLVNDGVTFDTLDWHWYWDPNLFATTVMPALRAFGKPIWLSECGLDVGSGGAGGQAAQASQISATAQMFPGLKDVAGYFAYELYDEPYNIANEAVMGLQTSVLKADGLTWTHADKQAFTAFQSKAGYQLAVVTKDATVWDGSHANTNYGSTTTLTVSKGNTSGTNRQALLTFDTSSFSGTVSSAVFRIYGNFSGITSSSVSVYSVGSSWTESGVKWNNKPALGTNRGTVTVSSTAQYWEINLTSFVQSQRAAGVTTISLALVADIVQASYAFTFDSKEGTHAPQLVLR